MKPGLRPIGFATCFPDKRKIPCIATAVLFDPGTGEVHLPHEVIDMEYFNELVEDQRVTRVEMEGFARDRCCFFLAEGEGKPEYLTHAEAAARFKKFDDGQWLLGDDLFRQGRLKEALTHYGLAGSAGQAPESFARMLLCPMEDYRRKRIEEALAQVATLDPPTQHIALVREELEAK